MVPIMLVREKNIKFRQGLWQYTWGEEDGFFNLWQGGGHS